MKIQNSRFVDDVWLPKDVASGYFTAENGQLIVLIDDSWWYTYQQWWFSRATLNNQRDSTFCTFCIYLAHRDPNLFIIHVGNQSTCQVAAREFRDMWCVTLKNTPKKWQKYEWSMGWNNVNHHFHNSTNGGSRHMCIIYIYSIYIYIYHII